MLGQHQELPRRRAETIEFESAQQGFVAAAPPELASTGSVWERGYVPGQPPIENATDGLTLAEEAHQHLVQHTRPRGGGDGAGGL